MDGALEEFDLEFLTGAMLDQTGELPDLVADPASIGDVANLHTYEDCETRMVELIHSRDRNAFEMGDTLVAFEVNRGAPLDTDATLTKLAAKLGCLPSQLSMWRAVSIFFPLPARTFENIRWSHYYVAMRHSGGVLDNALELLTDANTNGWSVTRFKAHINGQDDIVDDPEPDEADPPSGYAVVTGTGTISSHAPASQDVTDDRDDRVTVETPSGAVVDAQTGEIVGSSHVFGTGETSGAERSSEQQSSNGSGEPPAEVAKYELYTPEWLITRARLALGGEIDLDPASCKEAQEIVRANRYFDIETDGLSQSWASTAVFTNPPYGQSYNRKWAEKILWEFQSGGAMKILALMPASPGSDWYQLFAEYPRCEMKERVVFYGPASKGYDGGSFDSVLFCLGVPLDVFAEAFEEVGNIYVRYRRASK